MARVGYDEGIPSVAPETRPPTDYENIQSSPAEFGALIGQGEEKLGAGATTAGKFFGQVAADQQTTSYLEQSNRILYGDPSKTGADGQPDRGFFGLEGEDRLKAASGVNQQLTKLRENLRGSLITPEQQEQFDQNTRFMQFRMQGEIGRGYDEAFKTYAGKVNESGYQNVMNSIALRPQDDQFAQTMIHQAMSYRVRQLQMQGLANPDALKQAQIDTARDVSEARILALAPTNPDAAASIFNRDRPLLVGGKNYDALSHRIDEGVVQSYQKYAAANFDDAQKRFNANRDNMAPGVVGTLDGFFTQHAILNQQKDLMNIERQMALDNKIQTENAEHAGNAIVEQMIKDPTKVDPAMIASDPSLKFEQKLALNNMLQTYLTKPKGDLLADTYGTGFVSTMNRVLAPEGDPTRITDPTDLWKMAAANKDLSPSGIGQLTSMIEGRRTPDGEAASKIQTSAMNYAKQQLSFEMQIGSFSLKDPEGQKAYDIGFVPAFLKYWNDGLKAGKTSYELADKDAVDKVIQPFKRSPAQQTADMVNAEDALPGGAAAIADVPGNPVRFDTVPPPMTDRVPGETRVVTPKGAFLWNKDGSWHPAP